MVLLDNIKQPSDLKSLTYEQLNQLSEEIRQVIVSTVTKTGGHLGSNLGIVELTIALHRVFESPYDAILFDTGHQAYVHKLLTGRKDAFETLRQEGGISGYPNRSESEHDWIENSHASTVLSYAQGLATAFLKEKSGRRVVAVLGDGALTGGMAYEALNNLGHSGTPVIIVLNDNGRSYAPTISRLSLSLSHLRLHPSYVTMRERLRKFLKDFPAIGPLAYNSIHGVTSALRELIEPHVFFESLGVRYIGPIDGHNIEELETALQRATFWDGPIVLHVLTYKGKGYPPAEEDEIQRLHDYKIRVKEALANSFTEAFSTALVNQAQRDQSIVAITAAMPGPTGLLAFQEAFPDRFFDVGIAEQHAVTMAAGMAMGGLKPVVALYSTFFTRAFDQANLDVGLHSLPVVFVLDRAGITGDDGPSHNGVLDLVLCLSIPDLTIFAPSNFQEVSVMLETALNLKGPCAIRFPKTPSPSNVTGAGLGLKSRKLLEDGYDIVFLAVGKMVGVALEAADILKSKGIKSGVWDVRVIRPADADMLADALNARLIVTLEDGYKHGGAGSYLISCLSDLSNQDSINYLTLGLPTKFFAHAKPDAVLKKYGLDPQGVVCSVEKVLDRLASFKDSI